MKTGTAEREREREIIFYLKKYAVSYSSLKAGLADLYDIKSKLVFMTTSI